MNEEEKLDQEDQRIKEVELGKLDELNENASISCGDWIHRIRPVICNLSRRAKMYWTLVAKVVNERYKDHLLLSPVEKLNREFKDHEEADKEEFSRVKAVIHEMILNALPKEMVTEAIQKRHKDPIQVMLLIMIKYQPGSRKEREVILNQIGYPEVGWTEEKALMNLRLWKRKIERAKELEVIIPDPTELLAALDQITEKALIKDTIRKFRIDSARETLKVDMQTTYESVEKIATIIEGELDDMVTQSW